ncbi:hypothetical protein [Rhizobium glycinendophyticum]|uniref:Uncharacterized protein n=1 Tax=Rhizobium glycinendophyticum TaxID=2589807 RepID=A0A504UI02_9HYPH|nr:hypothetical protein [Rhizobium glycinendophyticum]TPP04653.1 hypothetical protein FJQ55_22345 [Rhizobium glycinendophyticum]
MTSQKEPMPRFYIKVLDGFQRVLGEEEITERDLAGACRAVTLAAALFCLGSGGYPGGEIVIEDEQRLQAISISLNGIGSTVDDF